jgi:lysophospholipase L1-like esterase
VSRRHVVAGAAAGGGGLTAVVASYALLRVQARLARRAIPALAGAPVADGEYAAAADGRPPLRLAVLGDSAGAGLGADRPDQTPGALLAAALAARGRTVVLDVLAVSGSQSADLDPQVSRALLNPPHVAVISIGANDVTHRVRPEDAVAAQQAAIERLQAAGARVVVGSTPDLSAVRPIPQPLRWWAGVRSRGMAAAQQRLESAGASVVPLGALLGPEFSAEPERYFCSDRFHPSPDGYRAIADALRPAVVSAAGLGEGALTT